MEAPSQSRACATADAREARQLTTLETWRSICPPEGLTIGEYVRRFEATVRQLETSEHALTQLVNDESARSVSLVFRGLLRPIGDSERLVPLSGWGGGQQRNKTTGETIATWRI